MHLRVWTAGDVRALLADPYPLDGTCARARKIDGFARHGEGQKKKNNWEPWLLDRRARTRKVAAR
jgi:hypothetical protein